MKPTKYQLEKIEQLLNEMGYTIRYEKGNFQSGYCIVESRKVAVINKFYDTEARIQCLLQILEGIKVEDAPLSDYSQQLYCKLRKAGFSLSQDTSTAEGVKS